MKQTERERVFLVKELPADLNKYKPISICVGDFFESNNPDALKIKQKGNHYHLIKKETNSARERVEHIIDIRPGEFNALIGATIQSHRKNRYLYPFNDYDCELDIYLDRLVGYARVEVEFKNDEAMRNFTPPEWFGEEITEINHDIHENLGIITFKEMVDRYAKRGITLRPIYDLK